MEIAPGVDMQRDIIDLLPFKPLVFDPKPMDPALFLPSVMGLRERLFDIRIEDRISYSIQDNILFLDFAGMRVETMDDIERIKIAVETRLEAIGRRVVSIVNYDFLLGASTS